MKNYLIDVRFRNADGLEETSTEWIKDADSQEQAEALAQARVASQIQNRKLDSVDDVSAIEIITVECHKKDKADNS
tara:strand:+ start:4131 stop:4358 length:228 start_codon:yes stop_codon:yes gene_type:complete